MASPLGYIAYIDEAGDDGLRVIKSTQSGGASRWLVVSAVLVKVDKDDQVSSWLRSIVHSLEQPQITHLHFYTLKHDKKLKACQSVAALPVRLFVAMSHKQNMEGYTNLAAEQARVNKTAWFYCWMSRLLLERVTAYCGSRCHKDFGEPRSLRIEFSDRGGVKIDDVVAYYRYLSEQSRMGLLYNSRFDLDWSVMDTGQMISRPNKMRAGLQLADVVASAFFQAVEPNVRGQVMPTYAKALEARMALNKHGRIFGHGLKVMPRWIPSRLPIEQREIFDFYER